jgi:cbb3-type cytochrome oxidase subunit 1
MSASSTQISWWKFWTDVGLILAEAIPLATFYLIPKERIRCVYYLFTLTFILTVMNVFKLAYADPRPYWVSP